MSEDEGWQRYADAANTLGQIARARVQEIARDLLATGETGGEHARQWTDELLERSRSVVDELVDVVRAEVTRQLETLGVRSPEDLLRRLTETFGRPGRPDRGSSRRDAPIDVSPLERAATGSASKQKGSKAKAADKKKPAKKAAASKKSAPRGVAKASQKSAKSAKKSVAKKSAGRGT
ncbi:MAG TPA: hypothetical protein VN781_03015 [Acidimicrobiales bacterium]|nr:hypothetical protein [Acidimicrobiales bacterium]